MRKSAPAPGFFIELLLHGDLDNDLPHGSALARGNTRGMGVLREEDRQPAVPDENFCRFSLVEIDIPLRVGFDLPRRGSVPRCRDRFFRPLLHRIRFSRRHSRLCSPHL